MILLYTLNILGDDTIEYSKLHVILSDIISSVMAGGVSRTSPFFLGAATSAKYAFL